MALSALLCGTWGGFGENPRYAGLPSSIVTLGYLLVSLSVSVCRFMFPLKLSRTLFPPRPVAW